MTASHPPISAVLLAGGRGLRMQSPTPKQFLPIQGKPAALYSFETLCAYPQLDEIIVVCEPDYFSLFRAPSGVTLKWAPPGELRQDSVFHALQCVSPSTELVCVHDSARPLLLYEDMLRVVAAAKESGAATLAAPIRNSIKESDERAFVKRTVDRTRIWEIYTPQVMSPILWKQGYAIAQSQGIMATDDTFLIELAGHPVKLVQGSSTNIKITFPEDLKIAEALLGSRMASV